MGDFLIRNQSQPDIQVRPLKEGVSLTEAKQRLEGSMPDGYDTIGFTVGDQAYLAFGQGLSAQKGEQVSLNGQSGQVQFFENESNSLGEGLQELWENPGGVARVVGGGATLIGFTQGGYMAQAVRLGASGSVFKSTLTGAAIGALVTGITIVAGSALASHFQPTHNHLLKELTR